MLDANITKEEATARYNDLNEKLTEEEKDHPGTAIYLQALLNRANSNQPTEC